MSVARESRFYSAGIPLGVSHLHGARPDAESHPKLIQIQRLGATGEGRRDAMPMPSKGSRKQITLRIPTDLYETLERRRTDAGISSVSQYVSDLLAGYAGREDLVRELGQEGVLDLLMPA